MSFKILLLIVIPGLVPGTHERRGRREDCSGAVSNNLHRL